MESHIRLTTALIGFVLLAGSVSAWAQSVERVGEDRISVHAESVSLGTLLRELAAIVPLDKLLIDEGVEEIPVSVTLQGVSFWDGIHEILETAGVNYVLQGGDGKPFRVFAGGATKPGPASNRTGQNGRRTPAPSRRQPSESVRRPDTEGDEAPAASSPSPGSAVPFVGGAPVPHEPSPVEPPTTPPAETESPRPHKPSPAEPPTTPPAETESPRPHKPSGDAFLIGKPSAARVALTITLLGFGLLLGVLIAGHRSGQ